MKTGTLKLARLVLAVMAVLALLAGTMAYAAPAPKAQVPPKLKITMAQANATALARFHGKVVGKTTLENEAGVWQYGVMVQTGKTLREVMVNANTGKIDHVEVTSASKENKEAQAEAAKEHPAKATPKPVSTGKPVTH